MPPMKDRTSRFVTAAWVLATVVAAAALTGAFGGQTLFGLPWIIYLAILCQLSLLGLYLFMSRTVWRIDEGAER